MVQSLSEQQQHLIHIITGYRRVAVAFSGGVDSALVARAAALALGNDAVAVTAVSPSLAEGELKTARDVARQIGIRHEEIRTNEFEQPQYQANAGNRCYFCKNELYSILNTIRDRLQVDVVCNGTNCDDLGDYRPGLQAADEHGVRSPLVEAGLKKTDVRRLAEAWELPVWDKPAAPCLSSRIAYGVTVTPERVRRVDRAEQFLKQKLNLRELRVRLESGELARIEVPVEALSQLTEPEVRQQIIEEFRRLGFRYVTLDLEGFRSGSLNQALPVVALSVHSQPAGQEDG